jgi:methylglutaconyl-CoA hydratase
VRPGRSSGHQDLIGAVARRPLTADLMQELAERISRARASDEGREGARAFLEKRAANWVQQTKIR